MKEGIKWILVGFVILLMLLLVARGIERSMREEIIIDVPATIVVENNTRFDVTNLIHAISHELFGLDTLKIDIYDLPTNLEKMGELSLQAYVAKNPHEDHSYMIYLSRNIRGSIKNVIIHELIHIKQMEDGELVQFPPGIKFVIWKGDTINFERDYSIRPYEIEAYSHSKKVSVGLDTILYK